MIDERKVRIMTRLAIYEKQEGAKERRIVSYYGSDYIAGQLLRTFISGTIIFLLIGGIYAFYHLEEFMLSIYNMSLGALAGEILGIYAAFLAAFMGLTAIVYYRRYRRASAGIARYQQALQALSHYYRGKDSEGSREET